MTLDKLNNHVDIDACFLAFEKVHWKVWPEEA